MKSYDSNAYDVVPTWKSLELTLTLVADIVVIIVCKKNSNSQSFVDRLCVGPVSISSNDNSSISSRTNRESELAVSAFQSPIIILWL